ncbi:16S rRNA (adenine(1518)-N(6)/adenine(1519)-N(6))-dimethyltransferase RsmA [Sodalis-like secondary symbiont of Drepanosiphum platanoidis]|uniref:16S rRNA (adenine(1518)-N(6)/adenine(1519)-N(6))- dimethyltransferase RsmA n=1 Tax=Sodalis-like secondary symbiont of Drepanosiphum platanoidis TaxID=2994493 RepID=UPI003463A6A3
MNKYIYKNYKVKKFFGQNFLIDKKLINSIISIINPKLNQNIIEIGPGFGSLTYPILKKNNNLTVIEIDKNLSSYLLLNNILKKNINIIESDARKINLSKLCNNKKKSLRIIGNLPYNISIQLLFHLFKYIEYIDDMYLMFQKEVANRLTGKINNKSYGKLSIMAQYKCYIKSVLDIPSIAFRPIPKVNSSLVYFLPYKKPKYFIYCKKTLNNIVFSAFNQRRKTIKKSLKNFFKIKEFKILGINEKLRAENITLKQYCSLSNFYTKNILKKYK